MRHPFQLLREQRFRPFFFTQFLGAFNDNTFKTVLVTLVSFHAASITSLDGSMLATLLPGLFILPFFLFSAIAGQIADKYEKSTLIRWVKLFEIWIMLLASLGFYWQSFSLLAVALFLMGVHSTLFGPVKYAYLPQHLQHQELIGGNGLVEMGTFVAILLGQVLGAWLGSVGQPAVWTSLAIILIAILGYASSRHIPNSPAADSTLRIRWNPLTETMKSVQLIWQQQTVWLAIMAISWFWFYGATLLAQFPHFAKNSLHGDETVFILLLSLFSVGIGIGSLLCEQLSKGKQALGLVVMGAIGLSVFGADVHFATQGLAHLTPMNGLQHYQQFLASSWHWRVLVDILMIGVCGGFYIVPLYVLIQTRVAARIQSRVIAANNIMNALFMVISAAVSVVLFNYGLTIPQLFLSTALLNLLVITYLCQRQPEYVSAFIAWMRPSRKA